MKNLIIALQIIAMLIGVLLMSFGFDHPSSDDDGNVLIAGSILSSIGLLALSITNRNR